MSQQCAGREMSSIELLRQQRDNAERIREAADAYLDAFGCEPRPDVLLRTHYRTVSGSLVYVARVHTNCKCPSCSAADSSFGAVLNAMLGIAPPALTPTAPVEHAGDEPRRYVVSVIRGGHGIERLNGARPGETYVVNADGQVFFTAQQEDREASCSVGLLAMAGLSLQRRVDVQIGE